MFGGCMSSLLHYAAAGSPAVCLESLEDERVIRAILNGAANAPGLDRANIFVASSTGSYNARSGERLPQTGYPAAIAAVCQHENSCLVMLDWQHVARNAAAYRTLRDALPALRAQGSMVVLVAPAWSLPPELEREVPVIPWALPTREELRQAMAIVAEA